jgi:hypothetical protein
MPQLRGNEPILGLNNIEPHLTQQYYEKSLNIGSLFDEQNINNLGDTTLQYKDLVDSKMVELHNKYDLRPRDKTSTTNPPKSPKANEVVVSKSPTEVQAAQIKQVETKATKTKKMENKEVDVHKKELENLVGMFNIENEWNKIKIPVPLVELAKKLVYKKHISKVINFLDAECQVNVINLQDEKPTIMFGAHIENDKGSMGPFYITLTVHDHLLHN